ncbi:MAG: hypothetical protein WCD16_09275 [Paracoccaceae bacterium]
MKSNSTTDTLLAGLELLLSGDGVPEAARRHGENLAKRLASPVRVVIAGFPRSGKTQLLNMLAGQTVVTQGLRLPSLRLSFGPDPRTTLTRQDSSEKILEGIVLEHPDARHSREIEVNAPLPILKQVSLQEVVTDASIESQRTAINWACARADILIWCTQDFSEAERILWKKVPDRLKDHAFLVLTKADELHRSGQLTERLADLEDVTDEEFISLQAVATLQGLAAMECDGAPDEAALAASGGRALIGAILKHVERGRRADIDSALLFLRQHGARAAGKPETAQDLAPVTDESGLPPAATAAADAPEPARPAARSSGVHAEAVALLRARAEDLSQQLDSCEGGKFGDFLGRCAGTIDEVADMFMRQEAEEDDFTPLHEEVLEAADMMLLLRLEDGEKPAEDAVTLMLQLRRDIETGMAA